MTQIKWKKNIFLIISIIVMLNFLLVIKNINNLNVYAAYENTYINTGNQQEDLVKVAETQIGYHEGDNNDTKYNRWNGKIGGYPVDGYGYPWCQCFISWCANQASIGTDIIPKTAGTSTSMYFFKNRGLWNNSSSYGGSYIPKKGDIIYYSKSSNINSPSHVGIVTDCDGSTVYTIEGNYSDKVSTRTISLNSNSIIGYATPSYKDLSSSVTKGHVMSESEGAGQTIPNGDYWILSALSKNFWIDIPGDEISKNGTNVTTYIREINELPSKYDAWTITYLNNGYYKISQKDTNLCLDVADASLYAGANVQIVNDNGAPAQQWSIIPTETGYKLQSRCNSFVLDITNGRIESDTNVMVWENNEQRTQRFGFIPCGTDKDRVIEDGTYKINSSISSLYALDADGAGAKNEYKNGTNIQLWTDDNDDYFKIIYVGNGYYKIQEVVSGLYVEVINDGNTLDTQANIQLYEDSNSLGQYWKIRKNTNDTYTFTSILSGYNLDLSDGKTIQRQNISQHFNNDSTAQQWILKLVGYVMSESEGAGQTIPNGDYWILSALSKNFWIDIPGDEISKNGTNVTTYIREINELPSKYDAWTITYLNNGYYKISQKDTNLCLDVADASLYAGANVQIVNDNGAPAQQWSIIPTETGYKLQSRCNSFVLDITNGRIESDTNVMVWENNEQRTQRFGFIPCGTDKDRVIEDGTYKINSSISSLYALDADGAGAKNEYKNGTNIQLWTDDNDDYFKIIYVGNGYYKIQEVVSGLYVEVINDGNTLDTQANIQLYEDSNSLGQYWKIRKNTNDTYTFTSILSGYNLDLSDGKTIQRQNISQHFNNDSTAQQWILKTIFSNIKGDCNNDGQITITDILILKKYILNTEVVIPNPQVADINSDGMVNVIDLILLKHKYINSF